MSESEHPQAWTALREGTTILDSSGEEVGRVTEVVGDLQKDIFSGISFKHGLLGSHHFIPADLIENITEENVHLAVNSQEAGRLEERST